MVEHGGDKTVEVLGGDSMAEMTGWSGGAITWHEKLLGRKCFWVVCKIHTNELPLRHLITTLDGKSSSYWQAAQPNKQYGEEVWL